MDMKIDAKMSIEKTFELTMNKLDSPSLEMIVQKNISRKKTNKKKRGKKVGLVKKQACPESRWL